LGDKGRSLATEAALFCRFKRKKARAVSRPGFSGNTPKQIT